MSRLRANALTRIADVLQGRQDVLAAYCFGSQADGNCPAPNDVDLAILGRARFALGQLIEIGDELSSAIGRDDVDLVDLRAAGPVLKRQVVALGRLLYCRNQASVADFELSALAEYRDSQHRRRLQYELLRGELIQG